jgi:hypothetical protein
MKTLVICILAALILLGCAGPTYIVEHYPGPRRHASAVATLRFHGADEARLVTVDGERADAPLADDARLHVEVLPGEHRVGVVSAEDLQGPLRRASFRAEGGRFYRVVLAGAGARVHEIDPESDHLLRDVTIGE